jgi:hypothetical protein
MLVEECLRGKHEVFIESIGFIAVTITIAQAACLAHSLMVAVKE